MIDITKVLFYKLIYTNAKEMFGLTIGELEQIRIALEKERRVGYGR